MCAQAVKHVNSETAPQRLTQAEREDAFRELSLDTDKVRQRKLDAIRDQSIHLLSIGLASGVPEYFKLALSDILVDNPGLQRELEKRAAKSVPIKMPSESREAYKKLVSLRKKIQKKMLYFEPSWFVPDTAFVEIYTAIRGMKAQLKPLREKIAAAHPHCEQQARKDLLIILSKAWPKPSYLDAEDRDVARQQRQDRKEAIYAIIEDQMADFPTVEECVDGLNITIAYGGRIPSIKEQAQLDAELAKAIAEEEEAIAKQNEIEAQELIQKQARRAELELLQEQTRAKRAALTAVSEQAIGKIYTAIGESIVMLQKQLTSQSVRHDTKRAIRRSIDDMERLFALAQNTQEDLGELFGKTDELKEILDRAAKGSQDYASQLEELKTWLRPKVEKREDVDIEDIILQGIVV